MKKFAAIICILSIVFGTFTAVAQDSVAETSADVEYAIAEDFLKKLEIITGADTISGKSEADTVTRSEFAVLAYRALNGNVEYGGESYFTDIPEGSDAYVAANTLAHLGAINGTGSRNFEPDGEIYAYDAAAVMLRLMGYKNFKNSGNNLFVAETCSRYNLLENSYLKRNTSEKGALLKIYYTLLGKNILEIKSIKADGSSANADYIKGDKTLLSTYFGIYKSDGVLNSNGIVDISGGVLNEDEILVDGLSIKTDEKIGVSAGMNVSAYYKNEDDPQLVAIYANGENKVKLIKVNDDVTLSGGKYTYYENGKSHKISVNSAKATFVYNNTLLVTSDEKYLVPKYGTITFIDNNNDGNYEVVDIKSYSSFVVNWVSQDKDVFTVRGESTGDILIDDDEPCVIKNADGTVTDAESISNKIVATCAVIEKDGKKYAKEIVLSDKYVIGTVDWTTNSNNKIRTVTVSGEQYDVYPENETLQTVLSPTTESAKVYIDFLGNVVDVNYISALGDIAAGYVVNIGVADNALSKKPALYIYDELGRLREYQCADKVRIDGSVEKDNILSILTSKNIVDTVILFKVDKNDEVNHIDTAVDYSDNLHVIADDKLIKGANDNNENNGRGLFYSKKNKSFGGRVNITDTTLVFEVPSSPKTAEAEEFGIVKVADLVNAGYYHVQGYLTNRNSNYSDIVVVKNTEKVITDKRVAVVTDIGKAVNKNGESVYSVHLYNSTGAHVYTTKTAALVEAAYGDITSTDKATYGIEPGDLIRYSIDADNVITKIVQTYDKSENVVRTGAKLTGTYSYGTRVFDAIPYDINDGYIKIVDAAMTDLTAIGANDYESISTTRIQKIYRVEDMRKGIEVTEIQPEQIKNYKINGDSYNKAVVSILDQGNTDIVVYEEGN